MKEEAQPRRIDSWFFLLPSALSPVAARELVVAARRPGTFRLRTYGALIAVIVLWMVSRSNVPRGALGQTVLSALGVVTLGFCMLAGLLLTASSIAAEKEGGTIGLLFLTDLKGYDIVLGKLVANSVSTFFGLLAVFPVLGVPLLIGGVTGQEFWRLMLVFGTTLFFSLSLGLAVSAMTSDPKKALGWALMLMVVAAGLLPTLWWLQRISLNAWWMSFLLWPSPAFAFRHGFDAWYGSRAGAADFWHSVLTLWVLTVLCLGWASFVTPRAWQAGEVKARKARRLRRKPPGWEKLEAQNPYCRVTIRDWAPSSLANLLLAGAVPIWFLFFLFISSARRAGPPAPFLGCLFLAFALHVIVKLLMIQESVSRINHDRDSGALELLLATPLSVTSIIAAHRKALRAHFRRAVMTLCLLNLGLFFAVGELIGAHDGAWIFTELFIGGVVALQADFEALLWVGLWHGLSKRRSSHAMTLTALQLLGPNWLFAFLLVFVQPSFRSDFGVGTMFAFWFAAGLVVDVIGAGTAGMTLTAHFRRLAAQRYDKGE